MIEASLNNTENSVMEEARKSLERGNIPSAVELYSHAVIPDTEDEKEARDMLIEARSHLSKKNLIEALDCFEEALMMGTEIQRRQALEGILKIGELLKGVKPLTSQIKKALKDRFGKQSGISRGIGLVTDGENVVLLSKEALESLPDILKKKSKILNLPDRLHDKTLPFSAHKCIPYTDKEDVDFILEVASALTN
jgi:hypothetical protein